MKKIAPLPQTMLRPSVDPLQFGFNTTAEITEHVENIGQTRALEALSFGIEMKPTSYHLYASGPSGLGKKYFIKHYLQKVVASEPPPNDWCYVNNFKEVNKPIALSFPTGEGDVFKQDMQAFVDQLLYAIPAMFESKEYRARIERMRSKYRNREAKSIAKLMKEANESGLMLIDKSGDYEVAPMVNGEIVSQDAFEKLPEKEKKDLLVKMNKIQMRFARIKDEMPVWYKEKHAKLKEIKTEYISRLVSTLIAELKAKYTDVKVLNYLRDVQQDIIDAPEIFLVKKDAAGSNAEDGIVEKSHLTRYEVNVIVGNDKKAHSPIIFERNPTYTNLVGQLEAASQHGIVVSDLTLIKAGALHKANGGYLIVEINKLLTDTNAWDSLKRILLSKKITIEPLHAQGAISSTQLQPEAIPLDVKVILLGYRDKYDLLGEEDDDFLKLFKVLVDFETSMDRTDDQIKKFIGYIARIIKRRKLIPFEARAVSEIINICIRRAGDSNKIALQRSNLVEIMEEANYWAIKRGEHTVSKIDVEKAMHAKEKRIDKVRKEYYDDIQTGTILIDLKNEVVGQINGLSVISLSNFTFGLPTRITASTRAGKASLIDIQREVDLGGANHSKGVLILAGFFKGRYAKELPFHLSASIVLEQTYGMIDGDSASLAELCALISSLSNVPIKQSIGITGSINQHGRVQSVGGINEKIEGFYDICAIHELTGTQGVIIPATNTKNLMLKQEVVEACANGLFRIYAVETIDEALTIVTGIDLKKIHAQCEAALIQYAMSSKKKAY